ncbi:hypothetical protein AVEN_62689-1 [Araneus ventricosus]|uniref:Pre-C2HC domain-containing protein n=1 Tax=Araneus ventricosus TaxID=182803 RepID=A0A4Y2FLF5_ARAVE|nr:hypothetical protein AVEN_62689-1 [Araneus ventricosus]
MLDNRYTEVAQLQEEREITPPPPKIQPIMIKNKNNYIEILLKLNSEFGEVDASLANEYIKIYPGTVERHRDMQKFCRAQKIDFYVIRPQNERPLKVVIKGIHPDTDIEEVKSELEIIIPDIKILKVSQLKNNRSTLLIPSS